MTIAINPVIPVWLIALGLLSAAWGIWATFRRCGLTSRQILGLAAIRMAGLMILAVLLLQPVARGGKRSLEKPTLAVVVDVSASMRDAPGADSDERVTNATGVIADRDLKSLERKYDLRWYTIAAHLDDAKDLRKEPPEFADPRSHLREGLNELQRRTRGVNLAGVLLLTDGLDQSAEPLTAEARRTPVLIPELEATTSPTAPKQADTLIDDVTHPKMLVVKWRGEVEVAVRRTTDAPALIPVHLYQGEEKIRTAYADFKAGADVQRVTFSIEPDTVGRTPYRVSIEPPDDTRPDNNQRTFMIDVTDPTNRILYLEGLPRWEFKFIKRALLKERSYHLSAFVRGATGIFLNFGRDGGDAELPELTGEELATYRVVILGELTSDALTPEQRAALATYVDKGGSLLCLGGTTAFGENGLPATEELKPLMPFTTRDGARMHEGRLAVGVSEMGRGHPLMSGVSFDSEFPVVLSLWSPVDKRPAAVAVVETADGSPLVLVQRFGSGKVAAILSDSLWRWQLGATDLDPDRSLYEKFYSQLVYWLSPQKQDIEDVTRMQLLTKGAEAEVRETVALGIVISESGEQPRDRAIECTVATPDGRIVSLPVAPALLGADVGLDKALAGWRAEFSPHTPGQYTIKAHDRTSGQREQTIVLATKPHLEHTGRPLDRQGLAELATQTGGQFGPREQLEEMLATLPYDPVEMRVTEESPLWNKAWILLALIALFTFEWYYRAKIDMV